MTQTDAHWTVLVAHPDTARHTVSGIAVEVRLATETTLVCNYSLHGDIGRGRSSGAGCGPPPGRPVAAHLFRGIPRRAGCCGLLRVQLHPDARLGGVPVHGLPRRHDAGEPHARPG